MSLGVSKFGGSLRLRRAVSATAALTLTLGALIGAQVAQSPEAEAVQAPYVQAVDSDLPTWDDVQKAKNNQSAAAKKITEIEALIVQVKDEVEQTRRESELATQKAEAAEEALEAAQARLESLVEQEKESKKEAEEAAAQAAALVSQMYRSGGVDRTLDLFLEADESTADALLDRLAGMEKATERNTITSEKAEQAMNSAKSLGEQAESARNERDRLRDEAEENRIAAAAAAADAQTKLAQQESQRETLEAQLAALKDKTTTTVKGYEERLKQEEAERKRLEREAAERAAAAAASGGGGGGSSSGGSSGGGGGSAPVSSNGWVKPLANGYWVSTEWWGYYGHHGIDLAIGSGTPIYAAHSGTVSMAGWYGAYGNAVFIDHAGGYTTRYGHMVRTPSVSYGQTVKAGQIIGYVGSTGLSTGPHLHFETLENGVRVNPRTFMEKRGITF